MHFPECETCGACCINNTDPKWIEVTSYDARSIPTDMLQDGDKHPWAMKQDNEGKCIALQSDNRCSIYNSRPTICRKVQRKGPICRASLRRRIQHDPDQLCDLP
jgi:Fe-S-cluster containining protein